MAELEQRHRHDRVRNEQALAKDIENHDFVITRRGRWFAICICIAVLAAAVVLALDGARAVAVTLAGIDLAALAAVFVAGRYLASRSSSEND